MSFWLSRSKINYYLKISKYAPIIIIDIVENFKLHIVIDIPNFFCLTCEGWRGHFWWFNFRTFADGFPNLFISNAHGIRGQHVAFLASFSSPGVIFEQLSVIYALPKLFVSSFTLVLPFFPTGTSERMEEEGDIATAFTLARILSNVPISRGGPTSLVVFDIHALQVSAEMLSLQYCFLTWF